VKDFQNPTQPERLVELVDDADRPLLVTSVERLEEMRAGLAYRLVTVLLFNTAGKVYLRKLAAADAQVAGPFAQHLIGRWDVSAGGVVLAGESRIDAARRLSREVLGLELERLAEVGRGGPEPGREQCFATVYATPRLGQSAIPQLGSAESTGYWVDGSELACLVERFRELLTPRLIQVWDQGFIFEEHDEEGG
jgi:8-oxo-dGTP pyrophosphatase MutT (NUDIX family)